MDEFCGSIFWNVSLSWNTSKPDLTECFENTVLSCVPCFFLWIFSMLEIYYYVNSRTRTIEWNWLNLTKFVLTVLIFIYIATRTSLKIVKIEQNDLILNKVDIYVPLVELMTFLLVGFYLELNRRYGLRTSGVLFIFWLLSTICGSLKIYSIILQWNQIDFYQKSFIIQFILTFLMFFANCFADRPPLHHDYEKPSKPCPESRSSFLSKILFSWFTPLAWKGYKNPLESNDLWDLRIEDRTRDVVPTFYHHWNATMEKNRGKNASVLIALVKSFGVTNLMAAFLKFIQDSLIFVSPFILRRLIDFVDNGQELWKGFLYATVLFVANSVQTIVLSQYFYKMIVIGVQVRSALVSAIYRKSLNISGFIRKDNTIGEIVNLMAVDTQKLVDLLTYLNLIWSAPYQIIVALYLLWQTMGISILSGVTLLIILIPVNTYIVNKVKQFQIRQMEFKDERIKITNEVMSGIKVLKLYAWELNFERMINEVRAKELHEMKKAAYMNAGSNFIWTCAPFLVSFVTFTTYVLIDESNVLDAKTIFVSISLFNILRFPMSMLPSLISSIAQSAVSLQRIDNFMNLPELDPKTVTHDHSEGFPLLIENGWFSWGSQTVLENINISIKRYTLTAIVGHVGSGKSSLISAFLGEMERKNGRVNTLGTIGYVSQQAWIQNATVRNNILFGRKFNDKCYAKVIDACALKDDFQMLQAGDLTEIGEKGINLSGGQKQRVNIARAVYSNRDVYLFDDPLSAVDSHVAKHLFDQVIGPEGLLKNKTRVLTTHNVTFLPYVDQIYVMKNGRISEHGTYKQLVQSRGAFAEFLEQHVKAVASINDDADLNELATNLDCLLPPQIILEKLEEIHNTNTMLNKAVSPSTPSVKKQEMFRFSFDHSLNRTSSVRERLSLLETEMSLGTFGQLTEIEKVEIGNVSLKVYRNYLQSMGIFLCNFILISNTSYQIFNVSSSFWLSKWSNDQHAANKKEEYLEIYGLFGLGQGISSFLLSFAFAQAFYKSAVKAHQGLLNSCLRAIQSFFDTTPLGRILNRFSNDLNCIDNTLPNSIYQACTTLFVLAGTLFVISYNSPLFIAVMLVTGVIYFFIQRVYQTTCRQLKRLESVSRSPIYSFFSETLTGTSTIRAYVQQERFIMESDKRLDQNQVCYYYGLVANRWLAVRLESIANFIILFAALFSVFARDTLSPGIVGLSVSYALQITQTLNWLVRMVCDVETNIVAIERIKEYSSAPQEASWDIDDTKPQALWPEKGRVKFENYSVRYRPELDLVLKDIDVEIEPGEKVGIVGRTGAGKSSLTLCLFRILEAASGSIFIDGVDISKIGLHSLRSKITIIPQDAVLFSGTLRMNLDPYNKHSDDELWKALEHAHLKKFISDCPGQLLYEVSEGGENFSIGQRQLICLSRALLRKSKLFILDEATAAVDLQTDDLIQKTIRTQFKHCTILTIAHRLNTIMDYDKILVLDKGRIKEFDTPEKLIKAENVFYNMCKEAKLI